MLHVDGLTEYLFLEPDFDTPGANGESGTFRWITDEKAARENAKSYYPWTEGIEVDAPWFYFVTKQDFRLFKLNLDEGTFSYVSTKAGLFDVSLSICLTELLLQWKSSCSLLTKVKQYSSS